MNCLMRKVPAVNVNLVGYIDVATKLGQLSWKQEGLQRGPDLSYNIYKIWPLAR